MKYKRWTIEKSGFNYRVRRPNGSYLSEIAATVKTAKKWIDAESMESRSNPPRKSEADEVSARELYLYIESDGDLYRQQHQPIMQNLVQKIDRGVYDREKAIKLYMYLVQSGAEKYVKDFGSHGDKWFEMFDKPTRELVAKNFVANFEEEYKLGNFTNETYHKKKYRGKEGMLKNPAMKMSPDHYGYMKAEIQRLQDQNPGMYEKYKAGGLSDMRYRWDLFHAVKWTPGFINDLYKYLHDNQIDTALRSITGKIGGAMKRNPVKGKGSYAFDVYLGKKNIDTIFQGQMTGTKAEMEEDVKRSLVNHDGYDSSITVRRRPAGK